MYIVFSINNQLYAIFYEYVQRISMVEPVVSLSDDSISRDSSLKSWAQNKNIIGTILYDKKKYAVINVAEVFGIEDCVKSEKDKGLFILISYKDKNIVIPVDNILGIYDKLTPTNFKVEGCDFIEQLFCIKNQNDTAFCINIPKLINNIL